MDWINDGIAKFCKKQELGSRRHTPDPPHIACKLLGIRGKGGRLDPSEFLLQRGQINWLRAPRLCHNSFSRAITRIDPRYMRRPWCKRDLTWQPPRQNAPHVKKNEKVAAVFLMQLYTFKNPSILNYIFPKLCWNRGLQYISYQGIKVRWGGSSQVADHADSVESHSDPPASSSSGWSWWAKRWAFSVGGQHPI